MENCTDAHFIANAANLNAIPDNPANYVNLLLNKEDIKQQIRRLVKLPNFFPGCDFLRWETL